MSGDKTGVIIRQPHRRHCVEYTAEEYGIVCAWFWERAMGYVNLRKFEGGAQWPQFSIRDCWHNYSDQDGATWKKRTPHSLLKFGGEFR